MKYLIFDIESSDIWNKNLKPYDKKQAWAVQFAAIILDDKLQQLGEYSYILRPPFKESTINPRSEEIHGISMETCKSKGVSKNKIRDLIVDLSKGDYTLVAHNLSFDVNFLFSHYFESKDVFIKLLNARKNGICTMKKTKNFVKCPPTNAMIEKGVRGYKNPKLIELHKKLFGKGFEGAHDALTDVRATTKCFRELVKLNVIQL